MKKLMLVCFVFISFHSFSQGFLKGVTDRLSFGIKAGGNYSNYSNAGFKTEGLAGFHAGAIVNFRITDHLSLQEEFLFSSQGAKVKDASLFGKENVNVYYVGVPFLLKYRTNLGLYVEAGTQAGMRVKEDIGRTDIGDFSKKLDIAGAFGIGYQSKKGFGIGARYLAGISKVGAFNLQNVKTDFRSNVFQAGVFYMF